MLGLVNTGRGRQRGLSLVELMLGFALGLFIVAVATTLFVNRLHEHRLLLVESRLMQDLRSTAALVARDLRRAGHWGEATAALRQPGAPVVDNPYAGLTLPPAGADAVEFRFSRDAVENHVVDADEEFGFRLHDGVVEMLLGGGSWQALTDKGTMRVLSFSITPSVREIALAGVCTKPCPAGLVGCPPKQLLRSVAIAITGRAAADAQVIRSALSEVRLRNDVVAGRCPG